VLPKHGIFSTASIVTTTSDNGTGAVGAQWLWSSIQVEGSAHGPVAMLLVFWSDPWESGSPDRAFKAEIAVVERLGLAHVLVDLDKLVREGDPAR